MKDKMTMEEMQAEMVAFVQNIAQRLEAVEQRDAERQERYDKLDAADREHRREAHARYETNAEETLRLNRRCVEATEDIAASLRKWQRGG